MNDQDKQALKALYRQTRSEQPSEQVDKRIREAAHRAVTTRNPTWLWSLSTAAVVLLSVSVVLDVYDPTTDETEILLEQSRPSSSPDFSSDTSTKPGEQPAMGSSTITPQSVARMAPLKSREITPTMDPESVMPEAEKNTTPAKQEREERARAPRAVREMQRQSIKSQKLEKKKQSGDSKPNDFSDQVSGLTSSKSSSFSSATPADLSQDRMQPIELNESVDSSYKTPKLPTSLDELLNLGVNLAAQKDEHGLVSIYDEGVVILTMQQNADVTLFEAYPGSEKLGVYMDWSIKPATSGTCEHRDQLTICQIDESLEVHFFGQNVIKIQWEQLVE